MMVFAGKGSDDEDSETPPPRASECVNVVVLNSHNRNLQVE